MLDPALLRFVEAPDLASAEQELHDLIEARALPLAHAIVARQLRQFRTGKSGGFDVRDRDDVVGDVLTALVERLWRARAGDAEPIEDFERYTATVAYSACAHEIRRRFPERARLKHRLRYLFSTDRRLALWTSDDELVCGRAEWNGRPIDQAAEQTIADRDVEGDWLSMDQRRLVQTVVALVDRCAGPTRFETVVASAASRIVEPHEVADALPLATAQAPRQDHALDQRRFLEQVWDEIATLPVRQRIALLLNLRDPKGSGILWLLPMAGIATIRQIARLLEIPAAEFFELWRDIPLDDAAIAGRLGCTRQQVINLRVSARKRLMNRVGRAREPLSGHGQPRAHLAPVSPSPKGTA